MKSISKRLMVVGLVASILGGCAVYEPMPAGSYFVNADGTRTYTSLPGYTCPAGYTCTYPSQQGYYPYGPAYYSYPPSYAAPTPYFWPPLFFGMGYYWGGYHHHHHPRR